MSTEASNDRADRFRQYALLIIVYLLGVIAFGAWVRVTGSGAGCGESWPTCHGQVVPRSPSTKTLIEFTHRLTSGLLGPLVLALPIWAWRRFERGHWARVTSVLTVLLVVVEAGIGAGLVLRGLVADNDSMARAVAVSLHLGNTLALMACAALTVDATVSRAAVQQLGVPVSPWGAVGFVASLVVVSCLGAVTALGDTLLPVGSAAAELAGEAHFLARLRIVHPLLAVASSAWGLRLCSRLVALTPVRKWAQWVAGAIVVQVGLGFVNIGLGAPGWLQLVHLLVAQGLWMSAVVLTARLVRGASSPTTPSPSSLSSC